MREWDTVSHDFHLFTDVLHVRHDSQTERQERTMCLAGVPCLNLASVYTMRMPRVNVYLPDDLAEEAKKANLNISSLTQEAIRSALAAQTLRRWQHQVSELPSLGVSHAEVLEAVKTAKDEIENG